MNNENLYFLPKEGEGDLVVMSIETYDELAGSNELYRLIQEGINDIENGKTLTENEVLKNMETAMELNEIQIMPYSLLIKKLPYIVTSFSTSIKYTKGKVHCWNRMRNQKVIIDAVIPIEIEKYIIKRIRNIDEFIESKLSLAILIKNSWYISYRPFKNVIIELINEYLKAIKDTINKSTVIIIDNLIRKKERPFDTFYAGDLAWLFGIYFKGTSKNS
jgi:hypothetical protein